MILTLRDRDVAALGDEHRVAKRLGMILEDSRHLLGRLQKELIAGVAKALRVVDGLPGTDAEKDVVRLVVALPQVVHVVGRNQRQLEIARERDDAAIDDLLLLDALVLHLEEEVVLAENVAQPRRRLECGARLLHFERARDLALEAAAQADQSGRMLGQQFLVDARPVVEPFGVAGGHQLDQVLVAFVGLGEQDQMVRLGLRTALLEPAPLRDVDLAPENRLEPTLARVIVKDHRREHVAVLGDGERRHLQLHRLIEQLVDPAGTVEQRELGMQVKVGELRHYDLRSVDVLVRVDFDSEFRVPARGSRPEHESRITIHQSPTNQRIEI